MNCKIKYNGFRNYSNSRTGFCESIQICDYQFQNYDPIENKCLNSVIPIVINCGDHGNISEDKSTCICDEGWTTDYDQFDYQNFKFCTIYQPIITNQQNTTFLSNEMVIIVITNFNKKSKFLFSFQSQPY